MLKIGNVELDVPFYQAPLSGYTDRPMRVLAKRFGCPLTYTGVLLDKIALHTRAIRKLQFQPGDDEHPVGAQILGADPETMAAAAANFASAGFDIIGLNFACPAAKVLRRGRGGALLKNPDAVIEILKRVREAVSCPVTMKLRIGWDSSEQYRNCFWEICERAAAVGPDAITIHGRGVGKKYRGQADWQIPEQVKKRFPRMTIIGSGDVTDAETVVGRINNSGLDGVAVARGAIGNPWIFTEARAMLTGKPRPAAPSLERQGEVMLEHFEMICSCRLEQKAVCHFRKFAVNYCKRHPQRKKTMLAILAAKSRQQVVDAIKHWYGIGGTV